MSELVELVLEALPAVIQWDLKLKLQVTANSLASGPVGAFLAGTGFSPAQVERLRHQIMAFRGLKVNSSPC